MLNSTLRLGFTSNVGSKDKFGCSSTLVKECRRAVGDFIRESKSEQYYDYKIHVLGMKDNPNQAFLYNGVLVNVNEMGNILWGATAAKFGFTSFWAQSGAYAFTLWDEGKEDEYGEQRAIEIGVYNWNNQTKEEQ